MTQQDPPSVRADESRANADHASVRTTGSTDALPVAPALGASLDAAAMPRESTLVSKRVVLISAMAIVLGAVAAGVAQILLLLINLFTDIFFYGRVSDVIGLLAPKHTGVLSPAHNHLGLGVIVIPAIGGLLAGDRKSTRLNSSHPSISYAVFCLK